MSNRADLGATPFDPGHQYNGPRDTAYPGANKQLPSVAGAINTSAQAPHGKDPSVIWPMGPPPVSQLGGGGTYTRSVLVRSSLHQPTPPSVAAPPSLHPLPHPSVPPPSSTPATKRSARDWDLTGSPPPLPPHIDYLALPPAIPSNSVSLPTVPKPKASRQKSALRHKHTPHQMAAPRSKGKGSITSQPPTALPDNSQLPVVPSPAVPDPPSISTTSGSSSLPPPPTVTAELRRPVSAVDPAFTPINESEPPNKKRATKRTAPLQPPSALPLHRELSPEVNYDDFHDRDKRTRLSPEVMEKIRTLSFDQLRQKVVQDPQYERLTVADKIEAENIYRTYQIAVYQLAIKNKLHIKPLLEHLGNNTRIRGPTNYNLFCKYHPVAGLIHRDRSLHHNERARRTGALWDKLDDAEQAQWKDQDYLDSLPSLPPLPPGSVSGDEDDEPTSTPRRALPRDRFQISTWLRNVKRDFRNMSTSHQLEGYLVLASRDPRRPVLRTAGSIMAEEFLDILADDTDQTSSFMGFGDNPDCAHCLGSKKANTAAIRSKLRNAIRKASHGAWQSGWPGTNTATVLRSLGVTLSVQVNDHLITAAEFCKRPSDMRIGQSRRVLTALANGWFKLTGPPAPDETVVGADDLTDHSDDSSDDGDSPGGDLAVISRPKKPLPHKKAPAAPRKVPSKKTPAAPKQAPIKAAPKRKTAPDAHRRRQSSSESSAVSSSSSDEGESLVGQLARESSSRSSSSDRSSLPSGQVPSRVHSDSDGSSLPSVRVPSRVDSDSDGSSLPLVSQPNRSPSVISNPPTFFLDHSPSPSHISRLQSPYSQHNPHTPSPPNSLLHRSFSESASDISEESRPLQQPQRLEGRERRSWTPVPCPEPWGTWHYYWPHELDLEAIEAGRPGPWDNDWVDPNVAQRAAWLDSLGLNDDSNSNEGPLQEDSSMSDGEHSDSTTGSSHHSSFDEFEYQRSESDADDGDYYDGDY
ncbi:hypothetical protein MJO28_001217 [Puccinia striiformis f. sp. tritici]|uniref:Uncharacterized protein n=1 Tax=Puccinia striiformis f. sp. tritici TaxID=168172 RepID=A0ACC0F1L9_9BASI|nr:hypothetical protein MJO28_001217 [Puccinia striiformis f. sp. tritici]